MRKNVSIMSATKNEVGYGVVLGSDQTISLVEFQKNDDVLGCARKEIGCDYVELISPYNLEKQSCSMLIDQDAKLRSGDMLVNCIASFLYKTQEHGDPIIGNAMIVKQKDDSLALMTGAEAEKLVWALEELRGKAIDEVAAALRIPPMPANRKKQSLASDLQQQLPKDSTARQPCKKETMER